MLLTLLKCITLCTVCLLQYGIVLLNLDKIYILKQFVSIDIRVHRDSDENTNKVEELTTTEGELVRDSNGFPVI